MKLSAREHRKLRKLMSKKRIGSFICACGALMFGFSACAVDGPDETIRLVYFMLALGITMFAIGATMADLRE